MYLPPIDKNSAEPLYLQIRHAILQAIQDGELPPHQRVPSERELSELMGVSRMTVRQALQALINDGYLYTVPGKGTFVACGPKIEQNLQRLSGFTEEVRKQGFMPGSRVLSVEQIPAGEEEAHALQVSPGTLLLCITRQRLVDNVPVALESAYLVYARFPGLDRIDFNRHSLYEVLQTRYGIRLVHARQCIEAQEANDDVARLLGIAPHQPVLAMERTTYADDEQPVEYVRSYYRADRFRLKVELHVQGPSPKSEIANVYRPYDVPEVDA